MHAQRARAPSAKERVVYVFQSGGEGAHPVGPLTAAGHGAYYATMVDGGATCGQFVCGTVLELKPTRGAFVAKVLYRFRNNGDGYFANTGLIVDRTGAIIGTSPCCYYGQRGSGVLFKLVPAKRGYTFTTAFAFSGAGPFPNGGLIADRNGTLFGTAYQGGSSASKGAVFKLTPLGTGYAETTIYSFQGGSDGSNPAAGLILGTHGKLSGTTAFGGETGSSCNQGAGCGTLFELTPSGSIYRERVLYRFHGGNDGNQPFASLVADAQGNLFGTTLYGGGAPSCPDGCGTVFELRRSKRHDDESVLYNFSGTGLYPTDPVLLDRAENLYGTTPQGGDGNNGTIFELMRSSTGYTERDVHLFQGPPGDGESPNALVGARDGSLVGTTYFGGSGPASLCGNELGCGVMFVVRGTARSL